MAKKENAFMRWYFSPQGKKVVGSVYSIGASVVIIGALFKILHWPGASEMLMVGMFTEALLFAIGILDKPFEDIHWTNIFPELTAEEKKPLVGQLTGINLGGGAAAQASAAPQTKVDLIDEKDVKAFSEGLKSISEAAQQMAGISKVAGLTETFAQNVSSASEAAASFASKQQNLDAATTTLLASYNGITDSWAKVQEGTKMQIEKVEAINKNLGAINSVYEIHLKNIQSQTEVVEAQAAKITAVSGDIDKIEKTIAGTVANAEKYRDETTKLAQKVADLNAIYGNMLSAVNS